MKDTRNPGIDKIEINGVTYHHKQDEQFDYLYDMSENEVKIHLKFTKEEDKRQAAINALKNFFFELL